MMWITKSILIFLLLSSSFAYSFDAGEHALLGDLAMKRYHPEFDNHIINLEAEVDFSYGHLIAMSADMYQSVEELALDEQKYIKNYLLHNRKKLKQCIDKEVMSIKKGGEYKKCSETNMVKRKFRYITLAHDNFSHFAWHNLVNYIYYHEQALWFAELAYLKCTNEEKKSAPEMCTKKKEQRQNKVSSSSYQESLPKRYSYLKKVLSRRKITQDYLMELSHKKLLHLALFTNAYGDHFLTDAFSAGHLRVPRSQIDAFVEYNGTMNKKSKREREDGSIVSGALTQYLHNLDGYITGIEVQNIRGDKFTVRGDKQLFSVNDDVLLAGHPEKQSRANIAIEAVGISIGEILNMASKGVVEKRFSALNLVPYIDYTKTASLQDTVTQHVKGSGSIKKALNQMSPEMLTMYRGALLFDESNDYKDFFAKFTNSINDMMAQLRAQIKQDIEQNDDAKKIPEALRSHLINIR